MDFKNFTTSVLFTAMFSILLIGFFITYANSNNGESITNDPAINKFFGNISSLINNSDSFYSAQREAFETDTPQAGTDGITLLTIVENTRKILSNTWNFFNAFLELMSTAIGVPRVVIVTLISVLIIIGIFSLWRVYRQGE